MPDSPDTALLARAAAGDGAAFAELVEPLRGPVFRHCYRMLGSGAGRDDATQDTMERAWRKLRLITARGRSAPGCSASRPTSASTGCGPGGPGSAWSATGRRRRPAPRSGGPTPELAWVEPVSDADLRAPGTRRTRWSAARRSAWPSWRRCRSWRAVSAPRCCCATCWDSATLRSPRCSASAAAWSTACCPGPRDRPRRAGQSQPDITARGCGGCWSDYVRAWQLADIDAFVRLVAEDVRFIMPRCTAWFDGREAVTAFVANAIFAARPPRRAPEGRVLQRPAAFATYEPAGENRLVVTGLQVLLLSEVDGQPLHHHAGCPRDPAPPSARLPPSLP